MPACAGALNRGRSLNLVGLRSCVLEIVSDLRLQNVRARAKNGLDAVSDHHHSGGAKRLQLGRVDLGWILELHAQSRDTCIEVHDIASPAERAHNLKRELVTALRMSRHGFLKLFSARGFEVELANEEAENEEVNSRPDRAKNEEPERIGRFREKHDVVDQPVRESKPVPNAKQNAHQIGDSRQ